MDRCVKTFPLDSGPFVFSLGPCELKVAAVDNGSEIPPTAFSAFLPHLGFDHATVRTTYSLCTAPPDKTRVAMCSRGISAPRTPNRGIPSTGTRVTTMRLI